MNTHVLLILLTELRSRSNARRLFCNKFYKFNNTGPCSTLLQDMGPPGVLGIWGEWLFIFRELGSTGNNLRGVREQAHNFRDLGSLAKKPKKKIRKSLHSV